MKYKGEIRFKPKVKGKSQHLDFVGSNLNNNSKEKKINSNKISSKVQLLTFYSYPKVGMLLRCKWIVSRELNAKESTFGSNATNTWS